MWLQRGVLAVVVGLAAGTAMAQSNATMRWPGSNASLGLQVGGARTQQPTLDVVGRAGVLPELGLYGRVGATPGRGTPLATVSTREGVNYGVGLRWDFSRSASATVGLDNYDMRAMSGELRDVRATSLGLQWRY
jgi:OmpA-OmpF porin, OOP family